MSAENPFAGEYPTLDEVTQVLHEHGFGAHTEITVTAPMDGSSGPLAEQLTRCKSADLAQGYPHMFKAVVGSLIKQASPN